MRKISLFIIHLVLVSSTCLCQNALLDGIKKTTYFGQGDGESFSTDFTEFSGEETGTCGFTYKYKETTKYLDHSRDDKMNLYTVAWDWKMLDKIELDINNFFMEIHCDKGITETMNESSKTVSWTRLYFQTLELARNAAAWIITKVQSCGGKASLTEE